MIGRTATCLITALSLLAPVPILAQPHVWVGQSVGDNAENPSPPVITVSRAGDGLGAPIVLRSSRRADGQAPGIGGAIMPSGFPLSRSRISSTYGMRVNPVIGGYRMHSGVDLAAPSGSPVLAPADGVISYANWRGGYGLLVAMQSVSGTEMRFGHLSQVLVSPGQRVSRGQVLGLVGSTGRSTGPHLHYEVRMNGRAVDPLSGR